MALMEMVVDEVSWTGDNGKTFERQKREAETRYLYRYEADGATNRALRQQDSG